MDARPAGQGALPEKFFDLESSSHCEAMRMFTEKAVRLTLPYVFSDRRKCRRLSKRKLNGVQSVPVHVYGRPPCGTRGFAP